MAAARGKSKARPRVARRIVVVAIFAEGKKRRLIVAVEAIRRLHV